MGPKLIILLWLERLKWKPLASDRNVKQKCYFPGRIAVISATIKDLKDAVVVIHVSPFNAPV